MFGRFLNNKKSTEQPQAPDLSGLNSGIDEDKIVIELQPQILARDGSIAGAEALSRYMETDNSVISPLLFVPLLESASIVSQLDLVVVKKVAELLARWKVAGHGSVLISINLSRIDFSEPGFMDKVHQTFLQQGIDPTRITFEIHESSLIDSYETMGERIKGVAEKGYHIAIDDFGSNGHLVFLPFDLPVDTIKFDISYLRKATQTPAGEQMAKGLISGMKAAGLQLISEGVESEEERDLIMKLGIDRIQGFLYDRPLELSAFENKYLER